MEQVFLGRTGVRVGALAFGTMSFGGEVDESLAAAMFERCRAAGVTLFDCADVYNQGRAEQVLGRLVAGARDEVVLTTKAYFPTGPGPNDRGSSRYHLARAVEASLRRLGTDRIDLYQLHIWEHPPEKAGEVVEVLEQLVKEGKIRTYGWSTDVKASVEAFARGPRCGAAQILLNVFEGNDRLIAYGEGKGLALLCRSPLAMGMLSGRYTKGETLPRGDVRTSNFEWITWFKDGKVNPNYARRLEAAREILTSNGRTLVQGALAWIWAKSPNTIPIPGFKNTAQAVENARAMEKGPLTAEQARQVAELVAYEDRNL